jgi:hypothetical protein
MRVWILMAASLALSACTFVAGPSDAQMPPPPTTRLTASGEAQSVQPVTDDSEGVQWAASVVMVNFLQNQGGSAGVKLFGTAGGDPAMNGLYTYIAFYQSAADGWRVFRLGDFLEYRIISDAPGRVNLEIFESSMGADDVIRERVSYAIVTWTPGAEGAPPETVTVTPAEAS